MTDELTGLANAVQRLRDLHHDASDADRPGAALSLALAISDLASRLPAGDRRRGELAAEALARLEESGDTSAVSARARERLAALVPGSGTPGPETIKLGDGDLNWDLDWSAIQGPTEMARKMTATFPLLAAMMPSGTPLGDGIRNLTTVLGAFDEGQWSPRHDQALAEARRQLEAAGSGFGSVTLLLRVMAMMAAVRRCQEAERSGARPEWPAREEFDALIASLEAADDLSPAYFPQFQAMDGLEHMYVVFVILARINTDIRRGGAGHDAGWRTETLQLIGRANDHLRQAPPAFAHGIAPMRDQLAQLAAALGQPASPPSAPRPPRSAPHQKARPRQRPEAPVPPPDARSADANRPAPPGEAASPAERQASAPSVSQLSTDFLEGMKLLAGAMNGPVPEALKTMSVLTDSFTSGRWLPEHEEQLGRLRQEAERLSGQEDTLPDSTVLDLALVMGDSFRAHRLAQSPRPQDRPTAADLGAIVGNVESALDKLARAREIQPGFMREPYDIQAMLHALAGQLLVDTAKLSGGPGELLARARAHYGEIPDSFYDEMPVFRDLSVLEQLREGRLGLADDAVRAAVEKLPNTWDQDGGDLDLALEAAARARQSRDPADIGNAILELQLVWAWLAAGSPARSRTLTTLGDMRKLLATVTGDRGTAIETLDTAIEATRAAADPYETRVAAHLMVAALASLAFLRQPRGPSAEAEEVLRAALADADGGDWALRVTLTTGIATAGGMRAISQDDDLLLARSRTMLADAGRMLPDSGPMGDWYATAKSLLCGWLALHAAGPLDADGHDAGLAPPAIEIIDRMESVLAAWPEGTGDPSGTPGGLDPGGELESLRQARERLLTPGTPEPDGAEGDVPAAFPGPEESVALARTALDQAARALGSGTREPLAPGGRPAPDPLRTICADLHRAMAGTAEDRQLRRRMDRALGLCQAELYWAGTREDEVLREAVVHLNRALLSDAHALPRIERADLLGIIARCYREAGSRSGDPRISKAADRTMLAALREHARCVMLAESTDQALGIAARASVTVARAIGWCLDDGRHREAIDVAETGRGLVLASVVAAGRVEETLRNGGLDDAADAWRGGTETGRAEALNALRDTADGHRLMTPPTGQQTALSMMNTRFDAVVYLVPPTEAAGDGAGPDAAERTGHALLLRPVLGQVEDLPLPALTTASAAAVQDYTDALDQAIATVGRGAMRTGGFRGGPDGPSWADALERLGRWTYERIMGPLLDHVRGWHLDHVPHLALIPIGVLAAVPYAAAWTDDETAGARRYAIEDLVLSYGASARLLAEVSRRPRQKLHERVVLVSDPNGEFPMTRRATKAIASRQYRDAEVYGTKSAPNGAATAAALLAAFPGSERPGASLLQLSTHGTARPGPRLQTKDGWLPLASVLEQARNRPPDAAGGLVITNACLTDGTADALDESLTLATAFLAAGATAVIGTRWPVDDDTTAILSLRLHHHLHAGRSPAEALRRAQLDLLRPSEEMRATLDPHLAAVGSARLSHPAGWAGQVHHGI